MKDSVYEEEIISSVSLHDIHGGMSDHNQKVYGKTKDAE